MRVAVVGAGAMGSIFAAAIARTDATLVLVDVAEPVVDRINSDGLTLVRDGEDHVTEVEATTSAEEVGTADVVFLFVKAHHLAAALDTVAALVGESTVVVSIQNGWGNGEVLAQRFDPDRLVVGSTYNSGTVLEPGRVGHTVAGPTVIGPFTLDGKPSAERVHDLLAGAGMKVHVSDDVRADVWKKLVLNAALLPASALTGLSLEGMGQSPVAELIDAVVEEVVAVGRAAGYDIDLDEQLRTIHSLLGAAAPGGSTAPKSSMAQDFDAGRPSEIDIITGAVLAEARKHDVPVPCNETLYALVVGVEYARGLRLPPGDDG